MAAQLPKPTSFPAQYYSRSKKSIVAIYEPHAEVPGGPMRLTFTIIRKRQNGSYVYNGQQEDYTSAWEWLAETYQLITLEEAYKRK